MIKESGCQWVILGHSERRHVFGEPDAVNTDLEFPASQCLHAVIFMGGASRSCDCIVIPAKAFARDYVFTGVPLSVCCHDKENVDGSGQIFL